MEYGPLISQDSFYQCGGEFLTKMAPKDERSVDKIFAGCLDHLPPLSSKVCTFRVMKSSDWLNIVGGEDIHQLHLH